MLTPTNYLLLCATTGLLSGTPPAFGDQPQFVENQSLLDQEWDMAFESSEELVGFTSAGNSSPSASFITMGDMNGDGSMNDGDTDALTMALTNPAGYAANFPGMDADTIGDFNGDGLLTNGDIAGFLQSLTAGEPLQRFNDLPQASVAPTPSAFAASVAALIALGVFRKRRAD